MTVITSKIPHDYKISFNREELLSNDQGATHRVCIRDTRILKAWTAQEAIYQFELSARIRYASDPHFCVLEVEPSVPDGALEREERLRLVPQICELCRYGEDELVKDMGGNYAHRSGPGEILDICEARVLHKLLETPVKVCMKDED